MARRFPRRLEHVIPPRRWVASITLADGRSWTAVVEGRTPEEAERAALVQHAAARVVLRSLMPP